MASREPERRAPDDVLTDAELAELRTWQGMLRRLAHEAASLADAIEHGRTVRDAARLGERLAALGDILTSEPRV